MWAWKDEAAAYINQIYWYPVFGVSAQLRVVAQQRWLDSSDRDILINLWRELTENYGYDYLVKNIVESNPSNSTLVIVGPRQIPHMDYLKENAQLISISIEASKNIRYNRIIDSWKELSYADFIRQEERDNGEWLQNTWLCMQLCEFQITNNWSKDELYSQINAILD